MLLISFSDSTILHFVLHILLMDCTTLWTTRLELPCCNLSVLRFLCYFHSHFLPTFASSASSLHHNVMYSERKNETLFSVCSLPFYFFAEVIINLTFCASMLFCKEQSTCQVPLQAPTSFGALGISHCEKKVHAEASVWW